jgi:hypothetical protein
VPIRNVEVATFSPGEMDTIEAFSAIHGEHVHADLRAATMWTGTRTAPAGSTNCTRPRPFTWGSRTSGLSGSTTTGPRSDTNTHGSWSHRERQGRGISISTDPRNTGTGTVVSTIPVPSPESRNNGAPATAQPAVWGSTARRRKSDVPRCTARTRLLKGTIKWTLMT